MSTFHDSVEVEPEEICMGKSKPNTILDYNQNKRGLDSVDQMTRIYSVKAPSRRWSMQVFYNLLNICFINSWVLFRDINRSNISRRQFLIKLAQEITHLYSKEATQSTPKTPIQRKRKLSLENLDSNSSPKRFQC